MVILKSCTVYGPWFSSYVRSSLETCLDVINSRFIQHLIFWKVNISFRAFIIENFCQLMMLLAHGNILQSSSYLQRFHIFTFTQSLGTSTSQFSNRELRVLHWPLLYKAGFEIQDSSCIHCRSWPLGSMACPTSHPLGRTEFLPLLAAQLEQQSTGLCFFSLLWEYSSKLLLLLWLSFLLCLVEFYNVWYSIKSWKALNVGNSAKYRDMQQKL